MILGTIETLAVVCQTKGIHYFKVKYANMKTHLRTAKGQHRNTGKINVKIVYINLSFPTNHKLKEVHRYICTCTPNMV